MSVSLNIREAEERAKRLIASMSYMKHPEAEAIVALAALYREVQKTHCSCTESGECGNADRCCVRRHAQPGGLEALYREEQKRKRRWKQAAYYRWRERQGLHDTGESYGSRLTRRQNHYERMKALYREAVEALERLHIASGAFWDSGGHPEYIDCFKNAIAAAKPVLAKARGEAGRDDERDGSRARRRGQGGVGDRPQGDVSGTKYEALAEARDRVVSRTFVPTGKVVIPKVSQAESTSGKARAARGEGTMSNPYDHPNMAGRVHIPREKEQSNPISDPKKAEGVTHYKCKGCDRSGPLDYVTWDYPVKETSKITPEERMEDRQHGIDQGQQ